MQPTRATNAYCHLIAIILMAIFVNRIDGAALQNWSETILPPTSISSAVTMPTPLPVATATASASATPVLVESGAASTGVLPPHSAIGLGITSHSRVYKWFGCPRPTDLRYHLSGRVSTLVLYTPPRPLPGPQAITFSNGAILTISINKGPATILMPSPPQFPTTYGFTTNNAPNAPPQGLSIDKKGFVFEGIINTTDPVTGQVLMTTVTVDVTMTAGSIIMNNNQGGICILTSKLALGLFVVEDA